MKIIIWELVAVNVAGIYVIARLTSHALTVFLVATLFLANISILFAFRHSSLRKKDVVSRALVPMDWANWTAYIPLVGGAVCVFIGVIELAWKPCVIGVVATAIGGLRIWSRRKVRRVLPDRHHL